MEKNLMIAVCGLDCGKCEARIATVTKDEALKRKVAREWSELNKVLITPEMICCTGCRVEGPKTPFCESLCQIRQCALEKSMETCSSCHLAGSCEKLSMITAHNEEARRNLGL